eukprot:3658603-Amphidinium_carterae.1
MSHREHREAPPSLDLLRILFSSTFSQEDAVRDGSPLGCQHGASCADASRQPIGAPHRMSSRESEETVVTASHQVQKPSNLVTTQVALKLSAVSELRI